MVPGAGLEPARLSAVDFESTTSTDFVTRANASRELYQSTDDLCKEIALKEESLFSFGGLCTGERDREGACHQCCCAGLVMRWLPFKMR